MNVTDPLESHERLQSENIEIVTRSICSIEPGKSILTTPDTQNRGRPGLSTSISEARIEFDPGRSLKYKILQ